MKQINETRLESDSKYRYEYLTEFIGFDAEEVAVIHKVGPKLFPLVAGLVDATYEKLLAYDATARHFLPRQHGFDGSLPMSLESLSQDAEQIKFRKEHLRRYLMSIVGNAYDGRMIKYLDVVGKMHTPAAGNKAIDVPLVQMNALMGLLADELLSAILSLNLEREQETRALLAFNKLLWIQNDFITRHYNGQATESRPPVETRSPV